MAHDLAKIELTTELCGARAGFSASGQGFLLSTTTTPTTKKTAKTV